MDEGVEDNFVEINCAENPTYFEDNYNQTGFQKRVSGSAIGSRGIASNRNRHFSHATAPISNPDASGTESPLPSELIGLEPEVEVFLPSETEFDSASSVRKSGKRVSPFGRLTQFFWKPTPKSGSSKASVGSSSINSVASRSRSESSGISSPPFTPDSSLSIYTNSLDSDSHSSSHSHPSTNSDHGHYPDAHFYVPPRRQAEDVDDIDSLPPLPTYQNQRISFRGRNYSLPTQPSNSTLATNEHSSYYNTQNFETFGRPSTRRHSIAAEAISLGPVDPSHSDPHSYINVSHPDNIRGGGDLSVSGGYLVPIKTRGNGCVPIQSNDQKTVYLNELAFPPTENRSSDGELSVVQVEVHTPTSSRTYSDMFCNSSASTAIPQSIYTNPSRNQFQLRQHCSSDSSSTIESASASGVICLRNDGNQPKSKIRRDYGDNGTGCEPYCNVCSSSSFPSVPHLRTSKMNIAILSCQDCFFSQRAVSQLCKIFDTMVGWDRKKLNINLQSIDLREVGENLKGAELHRAKVQIIIISHHFLDRLRHESSIQKKINPLNRILRPKRVIGVLLSGVTNTSSTSSQNEVNVGEEIQQYLLEFPNWEVLELKPSSKLDDEFYKKFTEKVVRIYNLEQRPPSGFSIFPKKVTKYQPKAVIFFKNVVENGDKVNVELRRGRKKELVSEVVLVNPYSGIIEIPTSLFEVDRSALIEITVTVNEQKLGSKVLKYDHSSHLWEDEIEVNEAHSESPESTPVTSFESQVSDSSRATTPLAEYYHMPRPTKQDYCIPPTARPVVPQKPKKFRQQQLPPADDQNESLKQETSCNSNSLENQHGLHYVNFDAATTGELET